MRKNLRRLGWAIVPVFSVALAACKNYDVKYAPFNPRQLQEDERTAVGPGVARPDRPLPTTLEVEFPLQATNNGQRQAATATTTRPQVPPATGPSIGAAGERVVQMPLRETRPSSRTFSTARKTSSPPAPPTSARPSTRPPSAATARRSGCGRTSRAAAGSRSATSRRTPSAPRTTTTRGRSSRAWTRTRSGPARLRSRSLSRCSATMALT
jgi:hypothetical protein